MGTHPIFESDFDCLTDLNMSDERERGDVITEMAQKPKVGVKYPHYIPLSVRKDREKQLQQRKPRDLLRNDIDKLSSEIRSLHRELTMMKDLPGPAMCKKMSCCSNELEKVVVW